MPAVFFCCLGLNEHIPGEQAMPGIFCDHPHRQAVFRIGSAKAVLNKQVATLEKALQPAEQFIKFFTAVGPVILPPPDLVFGCGLTHDEFVIGRPGGMFSGVDDYRSKVG